MFPLILSPIAGLLLYFGLRRTKRVTVVYTVLLLLIFIPIIPIFFTYLIYSNSILRDIILIVFFAVIIASLIQKGLIQRIIAILFLLLIILKGPLFGMYFPPTFDISKKIEVKKFKFDNYSLIFERTLQPPHPENDIYQWRAKKYYVGQILYNWISVIDSSNNNDKCIQILYISRVDSYKKGITSLERIVNYDTCKNKIVSIERH